MRILSMTATFGKLCRQTLELESGLNIIQAPNEWGKSTWCAFLTAMLYGIDTSSRSKTGFLPDKERYAPWSGEPMSGSVRFVWNDREITLERGSKGRIPLGEVKAFETQTGVLIPELMVNAPGQVLLGVERSVFVRAGFLHLAEMPVTEDEAFRRRLNELVTTGDESGHSDALAQKLRDTKNRCRTMKKNLLPELAEVEQKLQQQQMLEQQMDAIVHQLDHLEEQNRLLQNHKQALEYAVYQQYLQKLEQATTQRDQAAAKVAQTKAACQAFLPAELLEQRMQKYQYLRKEKEALLIRSQLLPPLPQIPVERELFQGVPLESLESTVKEDAIRAQRLKKQKNNVFFWILGAVLLLLGLVLLGKPVLRGIGVGVALCAVAVWLAGMVLRGNRKRRLAGIQARYRGIAEENWESTAEAYVRKMQQYQQTSQQRQQEENQIRDGLRENAEAVVRVTGGQPETEFETECLRQQQVYHRLEEEHRTLQQAEQVLLAMGESHKPVAPPAYADTMEISAQETNVRLSKIAMEQQALQRKLGQCQGQRDALGIPEQLLTRKDLLTQRIVALERHIRAMESAQDILQQATQELQRRFAPRISKRAQELFARLTQQRYRRLTLRQDLSVEVSAEDENTLRGTLWRSDGTVDQLYLALRLAVAEVLTPEAPLVLDDTLVRFDDTRLRQALEILQEEAEIKQVILFTCQSREREWQQYKEKIV